MVRAPAEDGPNIKRRPRQSGVAPVALLDVDLSLTIASCFLLERGEDSRTPKYEPVRDRGAPALKAAAKFGRCGLLVPAVAGTAAGALRRC